jgi:hypothetical protein
MKNFSKIILTIIINSLITAILWTLLMFAASKFQDENQNYNGSGGRGMGMGVGK